MEVHEVPQDPRNLTHDAKIKKLMYAVGKDGKYTGVNSEGWEAENVALQQAWEDIDETLAQTEARVLSGELSPVAYFMQKNLMDLALLSRYAGKWQWQVKRHLQPAVFKKLSKEMTDKYAEIFSITRDELINFGKDQTGNK
jgi:hypothetical protein